MAPLLRLVTWTILLLGVVLCCSLCQAAVFRVFGPQSDQLVETITTNGFPETLPVSELRALRVHVRGLQSLISCSEGYIEENGACKPCPAGTYWFRDSTLKSRCLNCPKGTYSLPASVEEASCRRCPLGFFAKDEGSSICTRCGEFATTADVGSIDADDCLCAEGYKLAQSNSASFGPKGLGCAKCRSEEWCISGKEVPFWSLSQLCGSSDTMDTIVCNRLRSQGADEAGQGQCFSENQCPTLNRILKGQQSCLSPYWGVKCRECISGYNWSLIAGIMGPCVSCLWHYVALSVLVVGTSIWCLIVVTMLSDRDTSHASSGVILMRTFAQHWQTLVVLRYMNIPWPSGPDGLLQFFTMGLPLLEVVPCILQAGDSFSGSRLSVAVQVSCFIPILFIAWSGVLALIAPRCTAYFSRKSGEFVAPVDITQSAPEMHTSTAPRGADALCSPATNKRSAQPHTTAVSIVDSPMIKERTPSQLDPRASFIQRPTRGGVLEKFKSAAHIKYNKRASMASTVPHSAQGTRHVRTVGGIFILLYFLFFGNMTLPLFYGFQCVYVEATGLFHSFAALNTVCYGTETSQLYAWGLAGAAIWVWTLPIIYFIILWCLARYRTGSKYGVLWGFFLQGYRRDVQLWQGVVLLRLVLIITIAGCSGAYTPPSRTVIYGPRGYREKLSPPSSAIGSPLALGVIMAIYYVTELLREVYEVTSIGRVSQFLALYRLSALATTITFFAALLAKISSTIIVYDKNTTGLEFLTPTGNSPAELWWRRKRGLQIGTTAAAGCAVIANFLFLLLFVYNMAIKFRVIRNKIYSVLLWLGKRAHKLEEQESRYSSDVSRAKGLRAFQHLLRRWLLAVLPHEESVAAISPGTVVDIGNPAGPKGHTKQPSSSVSNSMIAEQGPRAWFSSTRVARNTNLERTQRIGVAEKYDIQLAIDSLEASKAPRQALAALLRLTLERFDDVQNLNVCSALLDNAGFERQIFEEPLHGFIELRTHIMERVGPQEKRLPASYIFEACCKHLYLLLATDIIGVT